MATDAHIHWAAPATMVLALLFGALLALGHHLFYASLQGSPTPTGTLDITWSNVSVQQLNTAIGTAFAFLVKAFLVVAVSVAYFQTFWRAAAISKKGPTLANLDTTFSILGNALGFFQVHVWWRHPLLLLLALIAC